MTTPIPNHHHHNLITRRSILIGAAATLICIPAVVRATSLMPVRKLILPFDRSRFPEPQYAGFVDRLKYAYLERALRRGWDEDQRRGSAVPGLSAAQARNQVAYARAFGFLPKPEDGFYVEA